MLRAKATKGAKQLKEHLAALLLGLGGLLGAARDGVHVKPALKGAHTGEHIWQQEVHEAPQLPQVVLQGSTCHNARSSQSGIFPEALCDMSQGAGRERRVSCHAIMPAELKHAKIYHPAERPSTLPDRTPPVEVEEIILGLGGGRWNKALTGQYELVAGLQRPQLSQQLAVPVLQAVALVHYHVLPGVLLHVQGGRMSNSSPSGDFEVVANSLVRCV